MTRLSIVVVASQALLATAFTTSVAAQNMQKTIELHLDKLQGDFASQQLKSRSNILLMNPPLVDSATPRLSADPGGFQVTPAAGLAPACTDAAAAAKFTVAAGAVGIVNSTGVPLTLRIADVGEQVQSFAVGEIKIFNGITGKTSVVGEYKIDDKLSNILFVVGKINGIVVAPDRRQLVAQ